MSCVRLLLGLLLVACLHGCQKNENRDTPKEVITKEQDPPVSHDKVVRPLATAPRRFVSLEQCRDLAMKQEWGKSLRLIPSTVIDKGVLRNIPYTSMRAGDYEINVYGDPDDPCGVEIGIHNKLLSDKAAKRACIEYIQLTLGSTRDLPVLRVIRLDRDITRRNGLTYEVTPETEPDAYGGWWVSIYDEAAMENSRATAEELKNITVQKQLVLEEEKARAQARALAEAKGKAESKDDLVAKKPEGPEEKQPTEVKGWSAADLGYARPATGPTAPTSSSGSVYVKGYHRKDGTYVSPHTRSRPRR